MASPSKKPQSVSTPVRSTAGSVAKPITPSKGAPTKASLSTPDIEVEFVADSKHHQMLGGFYHLPHYRKLFEVLRGAHQNFKVKPPHCLFLCLHIVRVVHVTVCWRTFSGR